MELFNGRPDDLTDRPQKEIRCYDFLDNLGIFYQRIDHDAAMTMDACAEIDAVLGTAICKNLLLCNRQKTDFYLLMLPGDKIFQTSVLSKAIGTSRLSFADAEYMVRFLDITPGSLSVLGLLNDTDRRVRLLIDEELCGEESFGCHPCINTASLRIRTEDLLTRILPALHHDPTFVSLPRAQ